jgi:hypothetical protein
MQPNGNQGQLIRVVDVHDLLDARALDLEDAMREDLFLEYPDIANPWVRREEFGVWITLLFSLTHLNGSGHVKR